MTLRSKNQVNLIKIEAVEGVAEVLAAATDAIKVTGSPLGQDNPQVDDFDTASGSIDTEPSQVTGLQPSQELAFLLKGSGVAGVAPEFNDALLVSAFAAEITAAAVPGAPEACGAGASQTEVTLGISASALDQFYRGKPLTLGGTGAGDTFCWDYDGATKVAKLTDDMGAVLDATTTWQTPAHVLYSPASLAIPTLTHRKFLDGIFRENTGCRGEFSASLAAGKAARATVALKGIFSAEGDAAVPGATFDATRPPIFKGADNTVVVLDRVKIAIAELTISTGVSLSYPEDANAAEGFAPPVITARKWACQINPLTALVATRSIFANMRAGTEHTIHERHGSTAGNRVAWTFPKAIFQGADKTDSQGNVRDGASFGCRGDDAGAFLCFW